MLYIVRLQHEGAVKLLVHPSQLFERELARWTLETGGLQEVPDVWHFVEIKALPVLELDVLFKLFGDLFDVLCLDYQVQLLLAGSDAILLLLLESMRLLEQSCELLHQIPQLCLWLAQEVELLERFEAGFPI